MTNGYEEVYGDIASQRASVASHREQIVERRMQLKRPVVSGTAKQQRVAMRRVKRTPEYKTYVVAKEEQLGALGSMEGELSTYESDIAEYESKVKGYQSEGYDVSKGEEGELQFSKQTYVPGKRVQVGTRKVSIRVHWIHNITGKTGSFLGHNTSYDKAVAQLTASNRSVTKVTTIGGGEPIYDTTKGYWTSKDIVLAEAVPIYETVPVKYDEKQIGELAVRHIRMDEKIDLGFDRKPLPSTSVTNVETLLGRQIAPSKVETFKGITEARIVGYEKIKGMPDPYAWTKGELKKIDIAYEKNILFGATAEVGFGITSSFAGSIQSVHSLFGYKPKHEYISVLDAYIDPTAKQIYKERPILYHGGAFGEAIQVAAFLAGPSAVKTGLVSGTKFIVKKTPKVISKLKIFTGVSRPLFQSESMLLESGKIIGRRSTLITKTFGKVEAFGQTQFWKGISGWSEGKLVFAKAYPVVKGYPKILRGEDFYVKITKYKGFGKRVLEIPKVVKQEQVGSALSIQFTGTGGGELSRSITYRSIFKPKGLFRKEIEQVFVSYRKGSTYQKIIEPTGGEFIRAIASKELKRIPYMARQSFFKSTEATAQLVPTVTIPHHVSTMGGKGVGYLGREPLMLSISQMSSKSFIVAPIVVMDVHSLSTSQQEQLGLSGFKQIQRNIQQNELAFRQMVDIEHEQISIPSYMQASTSVSETIQKQQQKQLQSYKLITQQIYQPIKTTIKRYVKPSTITIIKPPPIIPFKLPDFEGDVKKRKKKVMDDLSKGYRYREWKVPTMKDILGINNM